MLNTRKYCDNTSKYCDNTYEYWPNTWILCSPASAIFANIVTILVSFEAILKIFSVRINFKSQFQSDNLPTTSFEIHQNCFKTYNYCDKTQKYCTCRWTHFSSIWPILMGITTIVMSIVTISASSEQVNTPLGMIISFLNCKKLTFWLRLSLFYAYIVPFSICVCQIISRKNFCMVCKYQSQTNW